jgi:hypothetical protein
LQQQQTADTMSMIAVKTREANTYHARPSNDVEHLKEDLIEEEEDGVWGFAEPFRPSWFFTITGAEYAHVYFWILKDLSWTQELKYVSLFFGTLATLWCVVIFYHAFRTGNKDEVYNTIALFMWIFANYWWMTGETHDADYPDEPEIYDQRASESARILECALALLTVYYFAIVPFNLMPSSPEALAAYDGFPMFKSRFSWLKTFRQYENLHMYFWLAKDLAWNRNNIVMWFVLLGPAVFLAGDFFFISAFCKNSIVDTVHYATIFLWVLGTLSRRRLAHPFPFLLSHPLSLRRLHHHHQGMPRGRWASFSCPTMTTPSASGTGPSRPTKPPGGTRRGCSSSRSSPSSFCTACGSP